MLASTVWENGKVVGDVGFEDAAKARLAHYACSGRRWPDDGFHAD